LWRSPPCGGAGWITFRLHRENLIVEVDLAG
jgi:hypothetical protein